MFFFILIKHRDGCQATIVCVVPYVPCNIVFRWTGPVRVIERMICNLSVSPGCIWRAEDNSMQDPGLPTLFLFPFLPLLFFYFLSLTLLIFIFLKPKGEQGLRGERGTEPKGGKGEQSLRGEKGTEPKGGKGNRA